MILKNNMNIFLFGCSSPSSCTVPCHGGVGEIWKIMKIKHMAEGEQRECVFRMSHRKKIIVVAQMCREEEEEEEEGEF